MLKAQTKDELLGLIGFENEFPIASFSDCEKGRKSIKGNITLQKGKNENVVVFIVESVNKNGDKKTISTSSFESAIDEYCNINL